MKKYDVVIVGAGPGGLFCAIELINKSPEKKILLIERGKPIEKRQCPSKDKCLHCNICDTMCGLAGAGAFSDGKVHYYPDDLKDISVGGNLHKYIGIDRTKELAKDAHDIYTIFGADTKISGMNNPAEISEIRNRVESVPGLRLPIVPVRHIGTEKSHIVFEKIQEFILNSENAEILFNTEVTGLLIDEKNGKKRIKGVSTSNLRTKEKKNIYSSKVVLAVGRSGSTEFSKTAETYGIATAPGTIDIGVRVEVPEKVLRKECDALYELKVLGKTPTYKDDVRTFCMNDRGFVTIENTNGITCVNGHANKSEDLKSKNTNFAVLVSISFDDIKEPMTFMTGIGATCNMLGHGTAIVQRLGDIRRGKRTWESELEKNSVEHTLKAAEAGDITFAFPYRVMKDILEFMDMLDQAIPGIAADDTLMYAPELKFYGLRPKYSNNSTLETNIKGLYAIGDGCGLTHGLIQASSSGLLVGRVIAGG